MKKLNKVLVVAALGMAAGTTQAQTANATFQVTANVTAACTVAATDLAFGNYSAAVANLDTTSTITIVCSSGKTWSLDIGAAARQMLRVGGGGALNYEMYSDPGRATLFPVTAGAGTGLDQNITVYGRIPGGQFVPTGSYAGTVSVAVTY
jgi:spore coat protein U-like protein